MHNQLQGCTWGMHALVNAQYIVIYVMKPCKMLTSIKTCYLIVRIIYAQCTANISQKGLKCMEGKMYVLVLSFFIRPMHDSEIIGCINKWYNAQTDSSGLQTLSQSSLELDVTNGPKHAWRSLSDVLPYSVDFKRNSEKGSHELYQACSNQIQSGNAN